MHVQRLTCDHSAQGPTTALAEPYLNDVTVFDVNTHTWHSPDVQGARPPVRDSHAAVALGNRMVIYGGDCGKEYLSDVWAYNVEEQKWQAFKVRLSALQAIAYSVVPNFMVLVPKSLKLLHAIVTCLGLCPFYDGVQHHAARWTIHACISSLQRQNFPVEPCHSKRVAQDLGDACRTRVARSQALGLDRSWWQLTLDCSCLVV